MSLVEAALRSQRKTWQEIIENIAVGGITHNLPPKAPLRILLFGVGSSFFAAKLTAFALIRESISKRERSRIPVIACSSMAIGIEFSPKKGDWVFAFSHRGQTPVTIKALQLCSEAGAFTILVTAKEAPSQSGARLQIYTSELEKCEPHTVGVTSAICAVTTLLLGAPAIKVWTAQAVESDPDLAALQKKVGAGPTLLLGEWEGEWIARETSLKLIEMAQTYTSTYGTEEFCHGPGASWRKGSSDASLWYISSPLDERRNKIQTEYLQKGPHDVSLDMSTGTLSWLSALVELQWMVLAVALNLGKDPDGIKSG
jgi:fructoselysine-6-P-deglycase FrlB-like protein